MSSIGKVNAALAAAIVFLLLSSCSAYLAFSRLSTSEGWVHHTRDVQSALAQFAMTTARAGRLRAEYVDSGDASILQQQSAEVAQIRNTVALIQHMTADNPQEQANCRRLSEMSEQRIALMDQSMELKRAGMSTLLAQAAITRQIVTTAEGTDGVTQRMYDAEEQLLAERQARVGSSSTVTEAILITSLFLALVLFIAHHQLLMDQVGARTRAETAQRALSARLLTLQDAERRKFARELHDSVGQHLAALKMAISILQAKLPGDSVLEDCLRMLDDSIAETRTISHLLHPPLLDEAGGRLKLSVALVRRGIREAQRHRCEPGYSRRRRAVAGSNGTGTISRIAGKLDQRAPALRRGARRRKPADGWKSGHPASERLWSGHACGFGAEPSGRRIRRRCRTGRHDGAAS
jgi:signal transduction histidine kinase